MAKRAVLIVVLATLGLSLAGCGPCGFFWEDWRSPGACRSDRVPQK